MKIVYQETLYNDYDREYCVISYNNQPYTLLIEIKTDLNEIKIWYEENNIPSLEARRQIEDYIKHMYMKEFFE